MRRSMVRQHQLAPTAVAQGLGRRGAAGVAAAAAAAPNVPIGLGIGDVALVRGAGWR